MGMVLNRWVTPDQQAVRYVCDLLNEVFGLGIATTTPGVTAAVLSTLEWMQVCGTWIWEQTGLINFEDRYSFTISYNRTVLSPEDYAIFGYDESLEDHRFNHRLTEAGLTDFERRECLPYVVNVGLVAWARLARDEGRDPYVIPPEVAEYVIWGVIVWCLSPNGRAWLRQTDHLLDHTIRFPPRTYWSHPEQAILDPQALVIDPRPVGTCFDCQVPLYCVKQRVIAYENTYEEADDSPIVFPLCNHCFIARAKGIPENDRSVVINRSDDDLVRPACPHQHGCGKFNTWKGGSCRAICPHSGNSNETLWAQLHEVGAQRARAYGEAILAGATPAYLQGTSTEGLEEVYK